MSVASWCSGCFCAVLCVCFCTDNFVMVPAVHILWKAVVLTFPPSYIRTSPCSVLVLYYYDGLYQFWLMNSSRYRIHIIIVYLSNQVFFVSTVYCALYYIVSRLCCNCSAMYLPVFLMGLRPSGLFE